MIRLNTYDEDEVVKRRKLKHNSTEKNCVERMRTANERLLHVLTTYYGVESCGKMSKEMVIRSATEVLEVIALERVMKGSNDRIVCEGSSSRIS